MQNPRSSSSQSCTVAFIQDFRFHMSRIALELTPYFIASLVLCPFILTSIFCMHDLKLSGTRRAILYL